MFKIFNLVVMTKKERANEALKNLKNMSKLIDRDGDILRLSIENELLRLRLEQAEKNDNDKTPEIKFGGF